MQQRQKGNGSNSGDGQSTENRITRVFEDLHIFIKHIASPLQHESTIITAIYYTALTVCRPSSFSKGVCKVFPICRRLRWMMQHV